MYKLGIFPAPRLRRALLSALGAVVAAAVARALKPVSPSQVAREIDRSHGLKDRIGSALAFAGEAAPSPFQRAAIADGVAALRRVDPARAAPIRRPAGLGVTGVVGAMAVVLCCFRFPACAVVSPPAVARSPRLVVDQDQLGPELDAAAQLAAEAADDPELKLLAEQLKRLLQQVDAEQLTRKEVFDRIAQLEQQLPQANPGDLEALKQALKRAGNELAKERLTKDAGRALAEEDLDKARAELKKLAEEARRAAERAKEGLREAAARALERAAKSVQPAPSARNGEEQRLREEQRRLQRELKERPNDEELKRQLQRNQRELSRLEREKQAQAERQRQLARLERELQQAAEQLRNKMSPEALKQLAEELERMQDETRKLERSARARMQIAEIKEVLRRIGRSSSEQGRADRGKGGAGKGDARGERLREFERRAGGKRADTLLLGGDKGDQTVLLPLPLPGGQQQGPGRPLQDPKGEGDGIGDRHDPNLLGDPTRLSSKRRETRVEGQEGSGPNRSETILSASEKGFATRQYRRVFSDYQPVIEEVMQKEQIPPGYRFFVKRYFQLIKPRE
jgi:hypothetical protein